MRIDSITLAGWKAYPHLVRLDVAALPGVVTAVCGPNGAGKTTLCTLGVLGALYREIPVQSCNDLAAARDAHVEVRLPVGGRELVVRQTFDGQRGGGKALVTDAATGRPIDACSSGGITEYRAWAEKALPAYDVTLSGTFLAQDLTKPGAGILAMTDGGRASVILRALGSDRLEGLAEQARRRATAVEVALATTLARLGDERARGGDVVAAQADLDTAVATHKAATAGAGLAATALAAAVSHDEAAAALAAARARLAGVDAQIGEARTALGDADALAADVAAAARLDAAIAAATARQHEVASGRAAAAADAARANATGSRARARIAAATARCGAQEAALVAQRSTVAARLLDAETRLQNNRALVASAPAIRAAQAAVTALDAEAAVGREEAARLAAELRAATEGTATATRAAEDAERRATAAGRREAGLRARLDALAVQAAVAALPRALDGEAAARALADGAAARLRDLREAAASLLERRHEALVGTLRTIAARAANAPALAAGALAADDEAADDAAVLPDAIAAEAAALPALEADAAATARRASELGMLAARAGEAEAAREELREVADAGAVARSEAAAATHAAAMATARAEATGMALGVTERRLAVIAGERATAAERGRHAARLDTAEERIGDLERGIAADHAEVARLDAALATLPAALAAETAPDADEAATALDAEADAADLAQRLDAAAMTEEIEVCRLEEERAAVGDVEARTVALATARAALTVLSPQREAGAAEVEAAEAELAALPPGLGVATARAAVDAARLAVEAAAAAVVRATDAAARAAETAARIAALDAERVATERDLAEWRELAADLGRTGLQADIVDAAAPTLTALTNDLLRSAGVLRWTVRFDTQKVRKDGSETTGFPLYVRDEVTGEEREARTYSGGETVLIGAGVSNAVAALACQRAGIEGPVLVRDESGAALDADNERAWMAMLRRTAEIVGASRIFVVTHSPRLRAMCDSVVWVGAGTVTAREAGWEPGGATP